MHKFLKLLPLCLLVSCGGGGGGGDGAPSAGQKAFTSKQYGRPIMLAFQDPSCQKGKALEVGTLGNYNLSYIKEGRAYNGVHSLSSFSSNQNLKSEAVKNIIGGMHFSFTHQNGRSEYNSISKGQGIKICDTHYSSGYLEMATLTTLMSIDKAYSFHKSLSGSKNLKAIDLLMYPTIVDIYYFEDEKKVEKIVSTNVDNAYYFKGSSEIAILPQGRNSYNKGASGFLSGHAIWEIPFVAAHEYGHHVFSSYYQTNNKNLYNQLRKANDQHKMEVVYKEVHPEILRKLASSKSQRYEDGKLLYGDDRQEAYRKVKKINAVKALNEGFADLFAYYSLGKEMANLKDINCFKNSRDVFVDSFSSSLKKELSSWFEYNYFSTYVVERPKDCNTPYVQDSHAMGAIMAFGVDKLFSTVSSLGTKKGQLLIKWLKSMDKIYEKDLAPKTLLKTSILAAFEIVEEDQGSPINHEQCLAMKIFDKYKYCH
ncbi:MAG: hypothetical protein HOE90_03855 [Bacteriovoracaceae bacterium]|jgi:hypothetical protein|nr:hypothetical protein [Bacteriovoracaceae bacterium]